MLAIGYNCAAARLALLAVQLSPVYFNAGGFERYLALWKNRLAKRARKKLLYCCQAKAHYDACKILVTRKQMCNKRVFLAWYTLEMEQHIGLEEPLDYTFQVEYYSTSLTLTIAGESYSYNTDCRISKSTLNSINNRHSDREEDICSTNYLEVLQNAR